MKKRKERQGNKNKRSEENLRSKDGLKEKGPQRYFGRNEKLELHLRLLLLA